MNTPNETTIELPVTSEVAMQKLNCGVSFLSAIKNAMGISGSHRIFMSHVAAFLKDHPGFKETDVYKRKPKKAKA